MKRYLLLVLLAFSISPLMLSASHYMGGEITWKCLSNGNYRFIMKVYRECHGVDYGLSESLKTNAPGYPGGIVMHLYPNPTAGRMDISPDCNAAPAFPHLNCDPAPSVANTGSVEEWVFTSDSIYPNGVALSGVPPAAGWYFYYQDCCRNPSTNLVGMQPFCLASYMYPFMGQNASTCYDNSPMFAEKPPTVMVNGYKTTYNSNAYDPEGDSLHFDWAEPLSNINVPITNYSPGYSFSSPLPSATQNSNNLPATIDPYTGQISYLSYTSGAFVTNFSASAYKNGILVSKVQRELQVVLVNQTQFNAPPLFYPPFPANITDMFSDTVYAGELVQFTLHAKDMGLINDSSSPQVISYSASGALFGTNFTSTTTGCLEPPCATLNPPPPDTALFNSYSDFSWQTDCNHVSFGSGNLDNNVDYYFVFNYRDDFCAVPGFTMKTVKIVVKSPILPAPIMTNLTVSPVNGNVTLNWTPVNDPYDVFQKYVLYYRKNPYTPWLFLDTLNVSAQSQYIHVGANGNAQALWYTMRTAYGCVGSLLTNYSNVIMNPLAQVYAGVGTLTDEDMQMFVQAESGTQQLICTSATSGELSLQLIDPSGRIVANLSEQITGGQEINRITLPALSQGVYIFRGVLNNMTKTGKFVVQH